MSRDAELVDLARRLFPESAGKIWAGVEYEAEARQAQRNDKPFCEDRNWLDRVHARENCAYSFGGYMENREYLMANCYQAKDKKFIHLGVDFVVPAGMLVTCPVDSVFVHYWDDDDQDGGWGRVIVLHTVKDPNVFYLLGHLSRYCVNRTMPTDVVQKGQHVGYIAPRTENGGWRPHLHVQVFSRGTFQAVWQDLSRLDGYAKTSCDPEMLRRTWPHPACLLQHST